MTIKKEIRVFYGDYKNKYYGSEILKDSYDKGTKTIVIKVPAYYIEVSGIDRIRKCAILAKELTEKFGIKEDFITVGYNEYKLWCPVQLIDSVVAELSDRIEKVTAVTKNEVVIDEVAIE